MGIVIIGSNTCCWKLLGAVHGVLNLTVKISLCNNNITGLTNWGEEGGGGCATPLNPNSKKQNFPDWPSYIFLENNLFKDQNISSIVIFLIILISFPFDNEVMLLGKKSLLVTQRGERGGLSERLHKGREPQSHLICTPPRRAIPPDSP